MPALRRAVPLLVYLACLPPWCWSRSPLVRAFVRPVFAPVLFPGLPSCGLRRRGREARSPWATLRDDGDGGCEDKTDKPAAWQCRQWANRYRVDVAFDGSAFSGWQTWKNSQAESQTAHYHTQRVLQTVLRAEQLVLVSAGRTDAGVHVREMPCHFDLPLESTLGASALQSAQVRCNRLLPPGLCLTQLRRAAPQWHAQFSSRGKTYLYNVHVSREGPDPFLRHTHLHVPAVSLNVDDMRAAAQVLVGTHNFSAFTTADRKRRGRLQPVKTLQRLDVIEAPHVMLPCAGAAAGGPTGAGRELWAEAVAPTGSGVGADARGASQYLTFVLQADGFLYRMCRALVGTLLEVTVACRHACSRQASMRLGCCCLSAPRWIIPHYARARGDPCGGGQGEALARRRARHFAEWATTGGWRLRGAAWAHHGQCHL